ncbi:hypothetical protein NKG94_49705 [Micromonospora sp. M12]
MLAGLLCRDPDDRLDHEAARRLLTTAATGRAEPPPVTDQPSTAGPTPGLVGHPSSRGTARTRTPPSRYPIRPPIRAPARATRPRLARPPPRRAGIGRRRAYRTSGRGGRRGAVGGRRDRRRHRADRRQRQAHRHHRLVIGTAAVPFARRAVRPWPATRPTARRAGRPTTPFACVRPNIAGAPVRAGAPTSGEAFRPPPGWVWYADASGFRISVPATWYFSRDGEVTCFQDPATGRALSVAEVGATDPLKLLRAARDAAAGMGSLPEYDEIRLAAGDDGAEWECRWRTPHGGPLLRARHQIAPPNRWTLGWITQDPDWARAAADWELVRKSFRPPADLHRMAMIRTTVRRGSRPLSG